ncbi:ABC transporter ATP-binding protein [Pedobacter cryoconitis]|uniref:ABC-2 type transport system ATP-binding protein n=1 Tax=Pedobacter cryoconitis TaxID=188932 RepID=A0A327SC52_9SPHI|nr:ATP-binding cassette domain-containing protein [Pedobacter cryoconitis]RAJ26195.1 ABC-2 type transport system ATP-binding protein [Pedobacter cryoconitis]
MLSFVNYQKSYNNFPALKIDDHTIDPGIYWIKGANGSGKSTLLKTIAGILDFKGDIILHPSTADPANPISIKKHTLGFRKRVNFAEAEPIFPDFLTGQEMVSLFSAAKGGEQGQAVYYIESMKMTSYINRPLGTYSSGMLKKLSLILAFLGKPEIILLDEPLITVDVESLEVLYQWITEKHEKDKTSFLLASHQPFESSALPLIKNILIENQHLINL